MVTYLWSKENGDKTEYIGLNGQVYDDVPEGNELLALQSLAQTYIGNENEYKLAFKENVATILGTTAQAYQSYYNTNNTCIPGYDGVRCIVIENGGAAPSAETIDEIDQSTGDKYLVFKFYNIKGEKGDDSSAVTYHVYYAYSDKSTMPVDGDDITSDPMLLNTVTWVGIWVTRTVRSAIGRVSDYQWINIRPNDASGRFVSYAFTRRMSKPATPYGGNFDNPVPTDPSGVTTWSESIPDGTTASIWSTHALFIEGEAGPHGSGWTEPTLMADMAQSQVEWATADTKTDKVFKGELTLPDLNNYTNQNGVIDIARWRTDIVDTYGSWVGDATTATTYMATCSLANGAWGPWEVVKIKGEDGKNGVNGGRVFMVYTSLPSAVTPYTPSSVVAVWDLNNDCLSPSSFTGTTSQSSLGTNATWSAAMPIVAEGCLLWMTQAEFSGNNGQIKSGWSAPIRMTGKDGENGADGNGIEYIYCRFATLSEYNAYLGSSECNEMETQESHLVYPGYEVTSRTQSDFVPYNPNWTHVWTDSPQGVSDDYKVEACSTRKQEEHNEHTVWGHFEDPIVWAARGSDGIDGDGIEYIFRVTETATETNVTKYGYRQLTAATPEEVALCEENPVSEIPDDEETTEESLQYLELTAVTPHTYWAKVSYVVTDYSYPYQFAPEVPPRSLNNESALDGLFGPFFNTAEGHGHLEITQEQKEKLSLYYQEKGFIPSYDKLIQDIADSTSAAYQQTWLTGGTLTHDFTTQGWCGGWTDSPTNVSALKPYQWCSMRKYIDGGNGLKLWQPFCAPFLWSQWSEDGKSFGEQTIYFGTLTNPSSQVASRTVSAAEAGHGYPEGSSILDVTYPSTCFVDNEWHPTGWSVIPLSIAAGSVNYVWMAKRYLLNDGTWSYYSPAAVLSEAADSLDYEVEYSPYTGTPFTSGDLVQPSGCTNPDGSFDEATWREMQENERFGPWSDTSSSETVWMIQAYRVKGATGSSWSNWDVIKVKGEKGANGQNGQDGASGYTVYTSFAFTMLGEGVDISDCTVTGGTFSSPIPTATTRGGQTVAVTWSDAPGGTGITWMTSAIFSSQGGASGTQIRAWSAPKRLQDTSDFEAIYSHLEIPGQIPTGFTPDSAAWWASANTAGWYDSVSSIPSHMDAIYMATITGSNGVFNDADWQIMRVKGEKGDPGSVTELEYLRDAFGDEAIEDEPGVILREVVGVKDDQDEVKAMINASTAFTDTTHNRVMFAAGINRFNQGGEVDANTIIYEDGHLKTSSAEISGTITGSNIYGGRITGATINGGSLNIGPTGTTYNFRVDSDGKLTSQDATISGDLLIGSGHTITVSDENNKERVQISTDEISSAATRTITIRSDSYSHTEDGFSSVESYTWYEYREQQDVWQMAFDKNLGDSYQVDLSGKTLSLTVTYGSQGGYFDAERITGTFHYTYGDSSGVSHSGTVNISSNTSTFTIQLGNIIATNHVKGRFSCYIDNLRYGVHFAADTDQGNIFYFKINIPQFVFNLTRVDLPEKSLLRIGSNGLNLTYPNGSLLTFIGGDTSSNQLFLAQIKVNESTIYGIKVDSSGIKLNDGDGWKTPRLM